MCGIAGIANLESNRPIDPDILQRMIDAMVKRGPDEEGFAVTDRAALGIRRLSIIDLEHGSQPIESEDGSVRVVLNGEWADLPPLSLASAAAHEVGPDLVRCRLGRTPRPWLSEGLAMWVAFDESETLAAPGAGLRDVVLLGERKRP